MTHSSLEPAETRPPGTSAKRILVGLLAVITFAVAFSAATLRSYEDLNLLLFSAPAHIVPAGHDQQVRLLRTLVPAGSTIFYLMDNPEAWQLGLWQRSLYPDYRVYPINGLSELRAAPSGRLRREYGTRYVLSAGNPPLNPGFEWQLVLPAYPNAIPTTLGRLPLE